MRTGQGFTVVMVAKCSYDYFWKNTFEK
jgi:hypothetical protein